MEEFEQLVNNNNCYKNRESMKSLLILLIISINFYYCSSQNKDSTNLYQQWNDLHLREIKWQVKHFTNEIYVKKSQEEIDYIEKSKKRNEEYYLSRKYFIEFVGTTFLNDDLILIERNDVHGERIYVITKDNVYHYYSENSSWVLYEKIPSKPFSFESINECMRVLEKCNINDKSQLTIGESLVFSRFSKCGIIDSRHIFLICESHIECIQNLFK